ncbi:hypothetical protein, partial [Sphingomonas sp.]|uniref:hypothetical protein n=1 Tax=Sphingomonas sp. TaxID=28214 RepID=UPI003B3B066C
VAVAQMARRVPSNDQSAEEVLRQRPDVVVADAFSDPTTVAMLRRLNMPLIVLPYAGDFAAIRATTLDLGHRIGAITRAERLAQRIDHGLELLAASPLPRRPRVAAWDGSGRLPPRGSLYDAVIEAAGADNVGRAWRGSYRIEGLIATRPDYLLHDDKVARSGARVSALVGHPLVRRLYAGRQIVIPQEQLVCGTPATIDATIALNQALRAALLRQPA